MGVQESLGVVCSKLNGAQKYKEMWRYLWKAIIISVSLAGLFHIFSINAKDILTTMGVEAEVAVACGALLKRCFFYLYIQCINQSFNNFLSSQQITKPLFYLNLISIFVVYSFASLFIGYLGWREIGFAYTKMCQEIFNLIYYIGVIVVCLNKKHFEWPNLASFRARLWDFLLLNTYTALAFYGESLAFEINIYYAALLHNLDGLATWVSFTNITAFH